MTDVSSCRWLRFSLRSLFVATLVIAAFFGGYALATRQADEALRAERKARQEAEDDYQRMLMVARSFLQKEITRQSGFRETITPATSAR